MDKLTRMEILNIYLGEYQDKFIIFDDGIVPTWRTPETEVWAYLDYDTNGSYVFKLRGLNLTGNEVYEGNHLMSTPAGNRIQLLLRVSVADPDGIEQAQALLRRIETRRSVS
jgi:hypothetical protein